MDLGKITLRRDFGKGTWWPDYDHKPEKCYQFVQKGLRALPVSVNACAHHRTVVQAGGHAGLWAIECHRYFERTITFEPDPWLYACLERNCAGYKGIEKHRAGLSSKDDNDARLQMHVSAGSARIVYDTEHNTVPVEVMRLDRLELRDLDLLILDIEGHEVAALEGAIGTIQLCRPVIHVEELPAFKEELERWLNNIGYKCWKRSGKDGIYLPNP